MESTPAPLPTPATLEDLSHAERDELLNRDPQKRPLSPREYVQLTRGPQRFPESLT